MNGYNGNFAQQMELNRKGVERVLKIAHLDGKVVLVSMPFSRTRSVDANPDGTVTGKRSLFFGEKIEDEKENPYHKVVPTPQGWRIEINDGRIMEDLQKTNLTGKKLQTEFIQQFNEQLKQGIWESVLREKLTSIKSKHFRSKLLLTTLQPMLQLVGDILLTQYSLKTIIYIVGFAEAYYVFLNSRHSDILGRKLDHRWEYLMPPIEIDKVARSWAFLSLKGRTLVREVKPENK